MEKSTLAPVQLSKRRRIATLALITIANLLNFMDRFAVSGVLSKLQDFFDINDGYAGLLQTVYILTYMIFAPTFGYLGDRIRRRNIIVYGFAVWLGLTVASTFVPDNMFWLYLTLRALIGIGDASFVVVSPSVIGDLFADKYRSRALMVFYFAIPFGSGAGFSVSSSVSEAMNDQWQWGMRVVPIIGIFVWIALVLFLPEPQRGLVENVAMIEKAGTMLEDLKVLAKTPTFIFTSIGIGFANFLTGAMAWWVPTMIKHAADMPETNWTGSNSQRQTVFGALTVIGGCIGSATGALTAQAWKDGKGCFRLIQSDRAYPLTCAIFSLLCVPFMFAGTHLITVNLIGSYITSFFAISLACVNWAVATFVIMAVVSPSRRSTATGIYMLTSHALGDAPGPYIVGLISDALSKGDTSASSQFYAIRDAFYAPIGVMLLCGLMYVFAALFYLKDLDKLVKYRIEEESVPDFWSTSTNEKSVSVKM